MYALRFYITKINLKNTITRFTQSQIIQETYAIRNFEEEAPSKRYKRRVFEKFRIFAYRKKCVHGFSGAPQGDYQFGSSKRTYAPIIFTSSSTTASRGRPTSVVQHRFRDECEWECNDHERYGRSVEKRPKIEKMEVFTSRGCFHMSVTVAFNQITARVAERSILDKWCL